MPLSPSATDAALALVDQLKIAASEMSAGRKARVLQQLDSIAADLRKDAEEAALKTRLAPPTPIPVTVVGGPHPGSSLSRISY